MTILQLGSTRDWLSEASQVMLKSSTLSEIKGF